MRTPACRFLFPEEPLVHEGIDLAGLIEPTIVNFVAGDWTQIGDKTVLASLVEEITNVEKHILLDRNNLHLASVARKMFWRISARTPSNSTTSG